MPTHRAPQGNTQDQGKPPLCCQFRQIPYAQHNVIFLVAGRVFRYIVKIPQILFRLLQLDNADHRLGSCSQKLVLLVRSPGSQAGHIGAVSILIPAGHYRKRIFLP